MKIAILTPYYESKNRGNAVSVARWVRGLRQEGDDVEVLSLETVSDPESLLNRLRFFRPQVLHGVHAYRCGRILASILASHPLPHVISMRGTDVWHDLDDAGRRETVRQTLCSADRVTVLTSAMRLEVLRKVPEIAGKTVVIPQGVDIAPTGTPFPLPPGTPPDSRIILFPANIRRIKNILYPIRPLADLCGEFPALRLFYVGPVLEEGLKHALDGVIEKYPWVSYLGSVPHNRMGDLIAASYAVLNCSLAEGMSNALLEGMKLGKPVLAFRNAGSKMLIRDGDTGFVFGSRSALSERVRRLLTEPDLAARIGERAREEVSQMYTVEREVAAYRALYAELVAAGAHSQ